MLVVGKVILGIVLAAAFGATLLGLPGTVVVLVSALVWDLCAGFEWIPVYQLAILLVLTLIAEFGDQVLSAWGVRRFSGTSRGMWGSWLGGFAGAIAGGALGTVVGALAGPVGVVLGYVLGPLLGGTAGGFVGAVLMELTHRGEGGTFRSAVRAGFGAFVGRTLSVLLKFAACGAMVAIIVHSVYFRSP